MRRRISWLLGIRGRLMVWYLGVLGALLFGFCLFQTVTLTDYFRTSKATSMQQVAAAELASYHACSVRTAASLQSNAQALSILLGSPDISAAIVTPSGRVLAARSFGPYSTIRSSRLSATVIRRLVPERVGRGAAPGFPGAASCGASAALAATSAYPARAPPSPRGGKP